MPLCPHCQGAARPLWVLSSISPRSDFFQCEACARLSERAKGSEDDLRPVNDGAAETEIAAAAPVISA